MSLLHSFPSAWVRHQWKMNEILVLYSQKPNIYFAYLVNDTNTCFKMCHCTFNETSLSLVLLASVTFVTKYLELKKDTKSRH